MNWQTPLKLDPQRDDRASLFEAASAARQRAASTRENVRDRRLTFHGQRLYREQTREESHTTISRARETCANSRRSYHFGLDWLEPDESLEIVLLSMSPEQ